MSKEAPTDTDTLTINMNVHSSEVTTYPKSTEDSFTSSLGIYVNNRQITFHSLPSSTLHASSKSHVQTQLVLHYNGNTISFKLV